MEQSEGIDRFENTANLPADVQAVIAQYSDALEAGGECGYELCHKFQDALRNFGYTLDYGLEGVPCNLRPDAGKPAQGRVF